jgi:DNA gyrase subunit B
MKKYEDDKFIHLESDIEKIQKKSRMYISFSNALAAKAIVLEILWNCVDECKNPRSPGDKIDIIFDEKIDTIEISDNGRGIPLDILEKILTSLNSGSNIDSGNKADLKANILGRNGVGTLAMTALGEVTEVISYRGGTENKFKRLLFNEGKKVDEEDGNCDPSKHGLTVKFKPSKILGKTTQIIWSQIHSELVNYQFMNDNKIKMSSVYINKNGQSTKEEYKAQPFENILTFRNNKDSLISSKYHLLIQDDNVIEEIGGKKFKRFISMKVAYAYTNIPTPYIDSFSNGNNTIDNGSHLDGTIEGLCRYFQQVTKNTLTERDKLDIKWDDVKVGLSIAVALDTNMEEIYTSQTKHKILHEELEKLIKEKVISSLSDYFKDNSNQLKELINIVKINARASVL